MFVQYKYRLNVAYKIFQALSSEQHLTDSAVVVKTYSILNFHSFAKQKRCYFTLSKHLNYSGTLNFEPFWMVFLPIE